MFIGMMLRAYSQGVFDPQEVYEADNSETAFTNKVEGLVKEFIIKHIAGDTSAIRKEVYQLIYRTHFRNTL